MAIFMFLFLQDMQDCQQTVKQLMTIAATTRIITSSQQVYFCSEIFVKDRRFLTKQMSQPPVNATLI